MPVVDCLLNESHIEYNTTYSNTACTPFHSACVEGHLPIVERLLEDPRIDVNKSEKNNITPFHIACYQGHLPIVERLLEDPRIDIEHPDKMDKLPLKLPKSMEIKP